MKEHHVWNDGAPVPCARLASVLFRYIDFSGRTHDDGQVIVLDAVAPNVLAIFQELYARRFPIAKVLPMENYDGDDNASMADDNTSAFNHRAVAGSTHLSLHAYGAAIDINPVENPYLTRSGAVVTVSPPQGVGFLNRASLRPGKPVRAGLAEEVVEIFAANGFLDWGGDWDDPIDYQHFDIGRARSEQLIAMTPVAARRTFESVVMTYRHCVAQYSDKLATERRKTCTKPHAD